MLSNKITKNRRTMIIVAILLVALAFLPQISARYTITLLTLCIIYSIFAMSLDLLAGYMGHSSLGHASFFGVAAYAAAVVNTKLGWEFIPSVVFALLMTIILGMIFGLMVSNLRGVQFMLVNLALGQVVWGISYRWYAVTGGDDGIRGVARPQIGDLVLRGESYYYFSLIIFVVCLALMVLFVNSPFGQTIRGIKQSESRMRVLGYNVFLHKYITYIVSGFFAGVAGILLVHFNTFIGPTTFEVFASSSVLLMVLVGGAGTLFGPMVGATVVVLLENFVSVYTERWVMIMALLYVSVVLFLPRGIFGLIKDVWGKFFEKKKKLAEVESE